jgi:hypothetical protein
MTHASTKVSEALRVICVLRSVRTRSRRWRAPFSPITASILPSDQAHVRECEDHASSGKSNLDSGSTSVARAL